MSCRRNAFVVLCDINRPLAVEYLQQVFHLVPTFDELLQLAVLELIRKDSKTNTANKVGQTFRLTIMQRIKMEPSGRLYPLRIRTVNSSFAFR